MDSNINQSINQTYWFKNDLGYEIDYSINLFQSNIMIN